VTREQALLEDLTARVRELLCRVEGAEHFADYAMPLLEALGHAQTSGDSGSASLPSPGPATGAVALALEGQPAQPETAASTAPVFPDAVTWVENWFLPTFRRKAGGTDSRWCAQWWAHAEALTRFEALWRSWEVLRLDPGTGLATWLRDYLDPQLAHLMSADGTFAQCAPDRHEPLPQLSSRRLPS
jgi:hypothetical protein